MSRISAKTRITELLTGFVNGREFKRAHSKIKVSVLYSFINNAAFFNLANDVGSIEQGKRADMLLLSEDPSQSIDAFDSIVLVVINGVPIERNSLSANHLASDTPKSKEQAGF